MRSSKPSKREERRASSDSCASSSTSAWSSEAALRRQRHDPGRAVAAVRGLERRVDDVDAQHHPGAAAVRVVVDLTRAQRRRVAVVEEPQLQLGAEHRREGPLLGEPAEGMRDLREDVDAHGGPGYPARRRSNAAASAVTPSSRIRQAPRKPRSTTIRPASRSTARTASSISGTSVPSASSRLSLATPGWTSTTRAELPALLVHDGETDELEGVVAVRFRGRKLARRAPRARRRARPAGRA